WAFAWGLLFASTAANMSHYDGNETDRGRSAPLDRELLDQLIAPAGQRGHLLDPRAVQQVERRLRGLGQPPRSPAEMAEWLRRLGDLAPADLEGPMAAFLQELEADGRARRIELPTGEPQRWVLTEEAERYELAFGLRPAEPEQAQRAAETVLARFLQTHALVGLDDVLRRYPFEREWAARKLEEWATAGRLVALPPVTDADPLRWSAPDNLEQVERGSLALLRREVITCPAPQFVDFVLHWQGLHPASRRGAAEGLADALVRLEGLPLPAELWERVILPGRV